LYWFADWQKLHANFHLASSFRYLWRPNFDYHNQGKPSEYRPASRSDDTLNKSCLNRNWIAIGYYNARLNAHHSAGNRLANRTLRRAKLAHSRGDLKISILGRPLLAFAVSRR